MILVCTMLMILVYAVLKELDANSISDEELESIRLHAQTHAQNSAENAAQDSYQNSTHQTREGRTFPLIGGNKKLTGG